MGLTFYRKFAKKGVWEIRDSPHENALGLDCYHLCFGEFVNGRKPFKFRHAGGHGRDCGARAVGSVAVGGSGGYQRSVFPAPAAALDISLFYS